MRACVLTGTGGLQHLQFADVPAAPAPGPGEVRVALRAAALNHLDLFVAQGIAGVDYAFPKIVGADGAGVIDAVGSGVSGVRAGDRVMINPGVSCRQCEFCRRGEHSLCVTYKILGEHLPGTLAESITIPAANVVAIPSLTPALSWAEAAAFSLATLTAWRMVVTRARLTAVEEMLFWGVGGAVPLAALRIASLLRAHVFATS